MDKRALLNLKFEALQFWMTKDGLTSLVKHNGTVMECGNDNGILFTMLIYYHLYLLDLLDHTDRERFIKTERSLEGPAPGLYNRNPGRRTRDEAHDNYKALVMGSVIFSYPKIITNIVDYGLHNGFLYDNVKDATIVDPHLVERRQSWWYKWLGFDITRWRQGCDIAFYKICAGMMPTPPQYLWLLLSMVFSMFEKVKDENGVVNKNTDHIFLVWIVMETIFLKRPRLDADKVPWRSLFIPLSILYTFWKYILDVKTEEGGITAIFRGYFGPDHVIVRLSKEVKAREAVSQVRV